MIKINEIANYLLARYPVNSQEEWDNSGLFYNFFNVDCSGIVVGLDLTHHLVDYAIQHHANFIITHHPIYLNDEKTPIYPDKRDLMELLQDNKIVHLCMHTCFDKAADGTTFQLLKYLPNVQSYHQLPDCPYVFQVQLKQPVEIKTLANQLDFHDISHQPVVYDQSLGDTQVQTIGICAGSGGFFVHDAIAHPDIQAYLCGDIKWHDWLDAWDNHFPLIDINHATEAVFIPYISQLIHDQFQIIPHPVYPCLQLSQR